MKFIAGFVRLMIVIAIIVMIAMAVITNYATSSVEGALGSSFGSNAHIASTDVAWLQKTIVFYDVSIQNTEGFEAPLVLEIPKITVSLGDLHFDDITIKNIVVEKPRLHYEMRTGNAPSNLRVITEAIEKLIPAEAVVKTSGVFRTKALGVNGALLIVYEADGNVHLLPVENFTVDLAVENKHPARSLQDTVAYASLETINGIGVRTLPQMRIEQLMDTTKQSLRRTKDALKAVGKSVESGVKSFVDQAKDAYHSLAGDEVKTPNTTDEGQADAPSSTQP